jgi:hypothetical protein
VGRVGLGWVTLICALSDTGKMWEYTSSVSLGYGLTRKPKCLATHSMVL